MTQQEQLMQATATILAGLVSNPEAVWRGGSSRFSLEEYEKERLVYIAASMAKMVLQESFK